MPDIYHRIWIKKPVEDVYLAVSTLSGLRGWWNRQAHGDPNPGGQLIFPFKETNFYMRVKEANPPERVRWLCEGGPDEWVGTILTFQVSVDPDGDSVLAFGHRGWWAETALLGHCSLKWACFLMSLKSYLEEGAGQPFPDDREV